MFPLKIFSKNVNKLLLATSKKIRAERIGLELTQKEFAEFVEIKYPTYKNFEQSGKISFEGFLQILIKLNKQDQFNKFLDGFEFNEEKRRVNHSDKNNIENEFLDPIIKPSQKQITLDKKVFGDELFYSVEDGHTYEVMTFINIILKSWTERRVMLLIKYFGESRLKPYILKQKDIKLLKSFNQHIKYIKKRF